MCCFFVHHSVSPVCVPSSTPFLISGGKVWRMQSGHGEVGGWWGVWTCLQGNKEMVDWRHLQPSSTTFCWVPPASSSLALLPLVPVSDVVVEISEVRRRYPLAAHTISLYPSPQWHPRSNPHSRTGIVMLRQHFLYSQRLNREVLTLFNSEPIFKNTSNEF